MPLFNRKIFAVIGAGPKGIALAVKAKVLEEAGLPVDRVILIEKNGVAAHWSGDFGFTNGEMKLGTSPEKDVVFPLESKTGDEVLDERIRKRLMDFTWTTYLIQSRRFSDWVDRGRPAPCHRMWAAYLKWVSDQLSPQVQILSAEVMQIGLTSDEKKWSLSLKDSTKKISFLTADRLMLTGPGKTRMDFIKLGSPSLPPGAYDIESFWSALKSGELPDTGTVAVVGAGENAASALLGLSQHAPKLRVDLVSPKGFVSTRAENFYENQFYSQPEKNGWRDLTLPDRMDFVERTDLGVFSVHAMQVLNEEARHTVIPGRVVELEGRDSGCSLHIEYKNRVTIKSYDAVVLATGFDQICSLKSLFSTEAAEMLEESLGEPLESVELRHRIQKDLSVAGITPALHLPMLAGLAQGPGFSNLSCLGLLSDRVVLEPALARMEKLGQERAPILFKEATL